MDVPYLVHRSARYAPDRPLWLLEDRAISYAAGAERLNRIAHALLERGAPGDRVAIVSNNRFEALEIYLAAMNAGMAAVPLNPKLHPSEHAFMIADSGARFVAFSPKFAAPLASVRAEIDCVEHWIAMQNQAPGDTAYSELAEHPATGRPDVYIAPDDLAWLFYTSGTTGKPKGAMETHRNLITMVQQFRLTVLDDIGPEDVMFHAAPVSHGTASVGLAHLSVGAAQAFPFSDSFDATEIFRAIENYRVTASFLAPTMIQMLLAAGNTEERDLSSLRNIVYGGGPMYREVLAEALTTFGPVFSQIYGQGEAPMTCAGLPKAEHDLADPTKARRRSSVGREMPAVEIRVVDEQDRELPQGAHGEIVVRSDLVMSGYWNRPEATAETLRGGWLHTGDVGCFDEGGYLFITDRLKDMIISGGTNIYPREVEEAMLAHPDVAEVAVIGRPDPVWGEAVTAFVVPRGQKPPDAQVLIDWCRDKIASFKKPKTIHFVDNLPKSALGKVLKRELRDRLSNKTTADEKEASG